MNLFLEMTLRSWRLCISSVPFSEHSLFSMQVNLQFELWNGNDIYRLKDLFEKMTLSEVKTEKPKNKT